jgi:DNA repair exonuclease SbcCD nuclease subunit
LRFIHAADIHLDSPLLGLSTYQDAPADLLRGATRAAFTNLVSEAIELQVDFVIIAGDLYDGPWKDHNTGIYFCKEMGRLKKANIPVYLLYGNHDAESEMTRQLQLPDNVHGFGTRKCSTFRIEHLKVALHGRSFKDAATYENLVMTYPAPEPGVFNIGVLHTALEGNAAHAPYAPCSLDELHATGYDYWALGHVHEHRVWEGASTIVFPGNLQGRHIRETGAKGAVLVSVDGAGQRTLERLYVDVLRWHNLEVDVSACESLLAAVRTVESALTHFLGDASGGLTYAMRVTLVGKSAAHGDLFGEEAQLRQEVLGLAAALAPERLWIEKVRVRTAMKDDGATIQARQDALSDLSELLATAECDEDFLKVLQEELLGLVSKAPPELQQMIAYFPQIKNGNLSALVNEVRAGLLAHLEKTE